MIPNYPLTAPSPLWGLCRNHPLSLRATEGSVAILEFLRSAQDEASVVSLSRNDMTTQSSGERASS